MKGPSDKTIEAAAAAMFDEHGTEDGSVQVAAAVYPIIRAEVVAEVATWLRVADYDNNTGDIDACPDWAEAPEFADAIEQKFGEWS